MRGNTSRTSCLALRRDLDVHAAAILVAEHARDQLAGNQAVADARHAGRAVRKAGAQIARARDAVG